MFSKETFSKDLFASFVVFFIALPLCLSIAVAAGLPPIKGLFTGIIGGIFVGIMSGCPLQISGPSAGLAMMVLHVVQTYGAQSLIPLGFLVGIFQVATGVFKVAHWFQATPPALLKAMLSGVGALILMSQIYILFNLGMSSNGLQNLAGLPNLFGQIVTGTLTSVQAHSGIVGAVTIVILALWRRGKHQFFEMVPAPLVSLVCASLLVYFSGWTVKMVNIPSDILGEAFNVDFATAFTGLDFNFFLYAMGFAFIASAETLLCVSAVDKMAKTTSNYNRQILAQGIGNFVVGLVGAIPTNGVIVRSAANIEFGAKTKLSGIMVGVWLSLVLLVPTLLAFIPIPALAGLLIYTGFRLLDVPHMIDYVRNFSRSSIIFFVTLAFTVSVDLLTGVLAGFGVAVAILVFDVLKFDLEVEEKGDNKVLKFKGKLSFLDLPVLSKTLQGQDLEDATNLEICLQEVEYLDPAITEHLSDLKNKLEAQGKTINIKYSNLTVH